MKRFVVVASAVLVATLCLGLSTSALAALQYDQNVTPDVIFGSGNGNGFWTVDQENGIQLGLRAKQRYAGVYNSQGNGIYNQSTGISSGTAAKWNYEFAANLNYDGNNPTRTFSSVDILVSLDTDPSQGVNFSAPVSIFTLFPDNSLGTNATTSLTDVTNNQYSTYYVAQNSENVGWAGGLFNVNADATYDFLLTAVDRTTQQVLASTRMEVVVGQGGAAVPEPATIIVWSLLGLSSVFGMRVWRRRGNSVDLGSAGRQPWSQENRTAILEIIEKP